MLRTATGCSGSSCARRNAKISFSTFASPPGTAASAFTRSAAGALSLRAIFSRAADNCSVFVFETRSDRAVATASGSSSASLLPSIAATPATHLTGASFKLAWAIARSTAIRVSRDAAASCRRSVSSSWIGVALAKRANRLTSSSRSPADSPFSVSRSRKNPASAPPHSGWRPAIHQAVSFMRPSAAVSSAFTASTSTLPPFI